MKKFAAIFACLILAGVLCACGAKEHEKKDNDPAVVGDWAESYYDSGYTFKADGTGTDTFWDLTFTYTAADGELTIIYDDELWGASIYEYSVTGSKLSMTRKNAEDAEEFIYEKVSSSKTPSASSETESGEGASEGETAGN